MKLTKLLLSLCFAIAMSSCSNNDEKIIALDLTTTNVAGTYIVSELNADIVNTAVTQGATVTISTATKIGDTFQVDLVLNNNGTFTANGQYRVVTKVTDASGGVTETPKIVNVNNSGTYSVNTTNRTINFSAINDDLLNGRLNVNFFNETTLTLTQELEEVVGGITTKTKSNIIFKRK